MIQSIYDLRESGFTHSYNHDTSVGYLKVIGEVRWEVIEDLAEGYIVKKKGLVKHKSLDFKKVIEYLKKQKVL